MKKEIRDVYYTYDNNIMIAYPLTEGALHTLRKMLKYDKIRFKHKLSDNNKIQEFTISNVNIEMKNNILSWFNDPEEMKGTEYDMMAVKLESETTTTLICANSATIKINGTGDGVDSVKIRSCMEI